METKKNIIKQVFVGLKTFLTSKGMKTFYWQTADAFLAVLAVRFGNLDWALTPVLFAGLSMLTKYVNKNYLMSKEVENKEEVEKKEEAGKEEDNKDN